MRALLLVILVSMGCAGATHSLAQSSATGEPRCTGVIEGALCCVVGERTRCVDPAIRDALGAIRSSTIRWANDTMTFESEHLTISSPDLSHYEEGTLVLHWLSVEGDALVHAGSIDLGSVDVSEEWQPPSDPSDPSRHGLESDDVRLTWTYAIRGARCVELLAVSQRAVRNHGGQTTTEVTVPALGPALDHLPRFAFRAGGEPGDETLWTHEGLVDRRGVWRLETDQWRRVTRCDAQ